MNNKNTVLEETATDTNVLMNVIYDVARMQRNDFSAKDFIAQVRDRLKGTRYEEKHEFSRVAKLCGRALRLMRSSGYLSHTENGAYHIERDMITLKR